MEREGASPVELINLVAAAPLQYLQVGFIGYASTMGAAWMQYLIGDPAASPPRYGVAIATVTYYRVQQT